MENLAFVWDDEANGFMSNPFEIEEHATVHVELVSMAPVVILKMEDDGGWANYGQTTRDSDRYEIDVTSKDKITVKVACPVGVKKGYVVD